MIKIISVVFILIYTTRNFFNIAFHFYFWCTQNCMQEIWASRIYFFIIIFLCNTTNVKISKSQSETWNFEYFFLFFLVTFFPKVIFCFFMSFFLCVLQDTESHLINLIEWNMLLKSLKNCAIFKISFFFLVGALKTSKIRSKIKIRISSLSLHLMIMMFVLIQVYSIYESL